MIGSRRFGLPLLYPRSSTTVKAKTLCNFFLGCAACREIPQDGRQSQNCHPVKIAPRSW